jgi:hypothetical protein
VPLEHHHAAEQLRTEARHEFRLRGQQHPVRRHIVVDLLQTIDDRAAPRPQSDGPHHTARANPARALALHVDVGNSPLAIDSLPRRPERVVNRNLRVW